MAELDFDAAVRLLHKHSNNPDGACKAIIFLSEASRNTASDRDRLSEAAILKSLLDLLEASVNASPSPAETTEPTLRCIGNAIISSDEGRQIVTDHGFAWAPKCLRASPQRSLLKNRAFNALHNFCFDYPPAQKRCYEDHVHEDLLYCYCETYSSPDVTVAEQAEQYGDLLLSICEHRQSGDEFQDGQSRERVLDFALLLSGKEYDADALATVVEFALLYLRDTAEQERFIEQGLVEKVWSIFIEVEEQIAKETEAGDEENVKLLVPLSTSLTWCLSDMAAHEKFAVRYADRSDFIHVDIFDAIKSASREDAGSSARTSRLVSAACQALGNLLWCLKDKDTSTYTVDVMDPDLHRGLLGSVTSAVDAETLYSVVGLLIQMCRHSQEYRTRLCGDEQLSSVLRSLCENDSKEVRQGGMKLLQLLGKDSTAVREEYADLAKRVMESLVAEQSTGQGAALQQNGSVVELPD